MTFCGSRLEWNHGREFVFGISSSWNVAVRDSRFPLCCKRSLAVSTVFAFSPSKWSPVQTLRKQLCRKWVLDHMVVVYLVGCICDHFGRRVTFGTTCCSALVPLVPLPASCVLTCALGSFSGRFLGVNFVASLCFALSTFGQLDWNQFAYWGVWRFELWLWNFGVCPRKWQENLALLKWVPHMHFWLSSS